MCFKAKCVHASILWSGVNEMWIDAFNMFKKSPLEHHVSIPIVAQNPLVNING